MCVGVGGWGAGLCKWAQAVSCSPCCPLSSKLAHAYISPALPFVRPPIASPPSQVRRPPSGKLLVPSLCLEWWGDPRDPTSGYCLKYAPDMLDPAAADSDSNTCGIASINASHVAPYEQCLKGGTNCRSFAGARMPAALPHTAPCSWRHTALSLDKQAPCVHVHWQPLVRPT